MPAKLDRCVKQVKKQGRYESAAYGICNASLKKAKTKPKGKKKKYA
jgi:hypothetical protein